MLLEKYKPTTQKTLFHKDIVNHILKWIKQIKQDIEDNQDVKKILLLYGPIGCGKSLTADILFKSFQIYNINSDHIRTSEKINDVINNIVSVNSFTFANFDKWNNISNKKNKPNIIFVDNVELCDKSIQSFVDLVYIKHHINIPIVIISNNIKFKDIFNNDNCTFIEFQNPSLLEMTKLAMEINDNEKLELSKKNLKIVIDRAESDIRQLIFLLEQIRFKVRGEKTEDLDLDQFFNSMQIKMTDIDLSNKLKHLLNMNEKFDLDYSFNISFTEPQTISFGIYQNYLNNATTLEQSIDIIDDISYSTLINHTIFEQQLWDLYENYTMHSCVLPSYYIKIKHKTNTSDQKDLQPYKDISYNFLNSYEEVKRVHLDNISNFNKKIYNKDAYKNYISKNPQNELLLYKSDTLFQPHLCFDLAKIFISLIENINKYFDKNKKGKNTTKKEKFDLCDSIIGKKEESDFKYLTHTIYSYKLFETDIDWIILHKKLLKDLDNVKLNVNKIDLRVFKRLLNIFTMNDNQKILKSHTENALQYKILQRILNDLNIISEHSTKENYIDTLTIELDDLWNL
jgi:DNA polymerase III delta prime subunit|uniref:AAA+ ATPase domain-containing protein n=1 Tax=viral metagenome TaxID=1070528 RepID=A0A6C0DWH6_9ZZZZ